MAFVPGIFMFTVMGTPLHRRDASFAVPIWFDAKSMPASRLGPRLDVTGAPVGTIFVALCTWIFTASYSPKPLRKNPNGHQSRNGQPIEQAAVGLVKRNDDVIGCRRTRHGDPVGAYANAQAVGLRFQVPGDDGPGNVQQVAIP